MNGKIKRAKKALARVVKIHSGHMKQPDKAPSKESAATEMAEIKKAQRSLTKKR